MKGHAPQDADPHHDDHRRDADDADDELAERSPPGNGCDEGRHEGGEGDAPAPDEDRPVPVPGIRPRGDPAGGDRRISVGRHGDESRDERPERLGEEVQQVQSRAEKRYPDDQQNR